jgi:hypothetical protein
MMSLREESAAGCGGEAGRGDKNEFARGTRRCPTAAASCVSRRAPAASSARRARAHPCTRCRGSRCRGTPSSRSRPSGTPATAPATRRWWCPGGWWARRAAGCRRPGAWRCGSGRRGGGRGRECQRAASGAGALGACFCSRRGAWTPARQAAQALAAAAGRPPPRPPAPPPHRVSASFIFQPPLMPVIGLAIISSSKDTLRSAATTSSLFLPVFWISGSAAT